MIKWYIGYDKDESGTAYVLAHSLHTHSSLPISFVFINRDNLKGVFTREKGVYDSTDFSISRFLVPYLCQYEGFAIFSDCDMVVNDDPAKLWALRDDKYAVKVVKHNYHPKEKEKFLGHVQTEYQCKNWSSVMLFNNQKCRSLTLDYVNNANGLDLHQFKWIAHELIGDLPKHWNHLVDVDSGNNASLIHYTLGGPYFEAYRNCGFHQEWWKAKNMMNYIKEK